MQKINFLTLDSLRELCLELEEVESTICWYQDHTTHVPKELLQKQAELKANTLCATYNTTERE